MSRPRLPRFKSPSKSRSENMRAIRSTRNATTEKRLISLFLRHRVRGWRVRPEDVAGSPDFVFPERRVAVFVDGCFFHGCPKCGHIPKTNRAYWRAKIDRNRRRDRDVARRLRRLGYSVVRIWECELAERQTRCLDRIYRRLAPASSASIAC